MGQSDDPTLKVVDLRDNPPNGKALSEIGFPPPQGRGCGALVFDKGGDWLF